ncbi:hypothetical protein NS506_02674 [Nocardia seriolae]|uniref:Uncharacterized protein n=2 Tax=Nocardia seriolae TaxID=37332 RepID=A0ABC8ARK7_9NOCA|nr:hypothetical protein NS506_02674 [Nocardia seriolae]
MVRRGWTLGDNEPTDADGYPHSVLTGWTYSPSYGGVKMNEIEDLTPWPLLCCFGIGEPYDLPDGIEVTMAGNPQGCPDHATISHEIPVHLDDPDWNIGWDELEALLEKLESAARDLNPRDFTDCWFFGNCGSV